MAYGDFEDDRGFADRMKPLQDEWYKKIFPDLKEIRRETNGSINDREKHIDVTVVLENGEEIPIQEKVSRWRYSDNDTITIEYWQDRDTKEPGEFFSLHNCKYFFHAYAAKDEAKFDRWYMYKAPELKEWMIKEYGLGPKGIERFSKDSSSRASLIWQKYWMIPEDIIEYCNHPGVKEKMPQ